jgi:hypothetical protein
MSSVATTSRLGPALNGTLMAPAEFDAVGDYEDGWRYELIHGVLGRRGVYLARSDLMSTTTPQGEVLRTLGIEPA